MSDIQILGDPEGSNPEARKAFQKAEMFRERGNLEVALGFYREAANLDNYFAQAYYWILKLVPIDDREELTAEVRDALSRVLLFGTPDLTEATDELFGRESILKVVTEAINNYAGFAEDFPDDYLTRYQFCVLIGKYGESEDYEGLLEELIYEFPDHENSYITLYIHYRGGNVDKAGAVREKYNIQFGRDLLDEIADIDRFLRELGLGNSE